MPFASIFSPAGAREKGWSTAKAGGGEGWPRGSDGFRAREGQNVPHFRYIYTSDSFVAAQNAKEKAKAAEEARVAKAAAERKDKAAQNKAAEEARKKAAQVRRVESEKRKAVEASAKASHKELKLKKAAEKAARAKAAPVVQAAKKGKRAREDEEDNLQKQKPKK